MTRAFICSFPPFFQDHLEHQMLSPNLLKSHFHRPLRLNSGPFVWKKEILRMWKVFLEYLHVKKCLCFNKASGSQLWVLPLNCWYSRDTVCASSPTPRKWQIWVVNPIPAESVTCTCQNCRTSRDLESSSSLSKRSEGTVYWDGLL